PSGKMTMPTREAPRPKAAPASARTSAGKSSEKTAAKKTAAKTSAAKPAPKRRTKALDRAAIAEIFRRFETAMPEPRTELEYVNPFTLLIAVVLSAQSTDVGVNKATRKLFAIADTPEKMVALGEAGVAEHIKTVNFYIGKARNVIALSRML